MWQVNRQRDYSQFGSSMHSCDRLQPEQEAADDFIRVPTPQPLACETRCCRERVGRGGGVPAPESGQIIGHHITDALPGFDPTGWPVTHDDTNRGTHRGGGSGGCSLMAEGLAVFQRELLGPV